MIERPASRELDAILATVEKIREAEAGLRDLKAQVALQAQALASITDKRARIEAAFYAYWFAPEVNATDIAMGATGRPHAAKLLKLAGPVSLGIPCDRCGEDMAIRSRTQMKDMLDHLEGGRRWAEGYRVLCIPCEEAVLAERARAHDEQERRSRARQRELAAMPL